MEIEQRFSLEAAPDTVWKAFEDVRLLVECLPGASIAAEAGATVAPDHVPLLFKVKLGPIAAAFKGQGELQRDAAARAGAFSGSAVDARTQSRVKGVARFALQPGGIDCDGSGGGTTVTVAVDYTISGALAQFSREGIVRALAEQLTREFAANLQAALPRTVPSPAQDAPGDASDISGFSGISGGGDVPSPASPDRAPANASIDLWSVLKTWLRHWWASRRKTS